MFRSKFLSPLMLSASMLFLSASVAVAEDAAEATPAVEGNVSLALASDYMFRGQNLYDGISIQPAGSVTLNTELGSLTAGVWFHLSAEGDRQAEKFFEMDDSLTWEKSFGDFTVKAGHLWYTYPDDSDDINDTAEFFGGISYDDSASPFSLAPSFLYSRDYRDLDYNIYDFTISHTFECPSLGKGFNMTPFALFEFASNAEKVYEDNGLEQITVGSSFDMSLGDLSVTPSVNYTFKIDDNTVNEFWILTTIGYDI